MDAGLSKRNDHNLELVPIEADDLLVIPFAREGKSSGWLTIQPNKEVSHYEFRSLYFCAAQPRAIRRQSASSDPRLTIDPDFPVPQWCNSFFQDLIQIDAGRERDIVPLDYLVRDHCLARHAWKSINNTLCMSLKAPHWDIWNSFHLTSGYEEKRAVRSEMLSRSEITGQLYGHYKYLQLQLFPRKIRFYFFYLLVDREYILISMRRLASAAVQCVYTALLFTWTDLKSVFMPMMIFACACGPACSFGALAQTACWTWLHLLLCGVSNQAKDQHDDAINHPWRPIPSGRISLARARALRWLLIAPCLALSAAYGSGEVVATSGIITYTVLYDNLGMSSNPIGKALCTAYGYFWFQVGAALTMAYGNEFDNISARTITIHCVVIVTTIQVLDFHDVEGDIAAGKLTIPIIAPELSRLSTMFAMLSWSAYLGWYWDLGIVIRHAFLALGGSIGFRYYYLRSIQDDKYSCRIFSLWLTIVHVFPVQRHFALLTI